jgi:hypothetical protein
MTATIRPPLLLPMRSTCVPSEVRRVRSAGRTKPLDEDQPTSWAAPSSGGRTKADSARRFLAQDAVPLRVAASFVAGPIVRG